MHQLAAAHAVALRDPYLDRDLVELALALPHEWLYHRGTTKWILRHCTRGVVPELVRTRSTGTVASDALVAGMLRWIKAGGADGVSDWGAATRGYVAPGPLAAAFRRFSQRPSRSQAAALLRPVLLENWHRRTVLAGPARME